ncbi:CGNR zinc finger domain-containing protein [Lichenihabitans sp. Uapishka_5]|uniref:CGNR zinc finger domain-containing protein n=1 Tax=Lichenihabitans sp. Uapishka_5 TaxID=3037302 RepID=UPI0029E80430|nr:CGNR zinc finger domain-containing protein [Lichenihabitans sp. Uapishka_5]MDX7953280.1 CGNR zinc finger domain-containing protein [Lichenihabitans sp. Uapishka_5]
MTSRAVKAPSRAGSLALVGGGLALDFCNTSSGRGTDRHLEHLQTPSDVLTWACHAAIVDELSVARLRAVLDENQKLATRFLKRALELREAVYQLTAALVRNEPADQTIINVIAANHAACLSKGRLVTDQGAFGWTWTIDDAPEEIILGPITSSAVAIITAADRARLKRCEGHNCGWLFLDTTKSNNRVWCEMEPCGNRAKQSRRRHSRLRGEP